MITEADIDEMPFQFQSLKWGWAIRADGSEYKDGEFEAEMAKHRQDLAFYKQQTNKGKGRLGSKTVEVTDPVVKETITPSGLHIAIAKALDRAGYDLGPFTREMSLELIDLWDETDFASRCLAMVVHPNAGALHYHPIQTRVDSDNTLVNKNTHRGNNRSSRAGIPLIAALRWREQGFLPPEDGKKLDRYLEKRRAKTGCLPPDYLLSCYVDQRFDELIVELKKDKKYKQVIERAEREYRDRVERKLLEDKLVRTILEKKLSKGQLEKLLEGQSDLQIDDIEDTPTEPKQPKAEEPSKGSVESTESRSNEVSQSSEMQDHADLEDVNPESSRPTRRPAEVEVSAEVERLREEAEAEAASPKAPAEHTAPTAETQKSKQAASRMVVDARAIGLRADNNGEASPAELEGSSRDATESVAAEPAFDKDNLEHIKRENQQRLESWAKSKEAEAIRRALKQKLRHNEQEDHGPDMG